MVDLGFLLLVAAGALIVGFAWGFLSSAWKDGRDPACADPYCSYRAEAGLQDERCRATGCVVRSNSTAPRVGQYWMYRGVVCVVRSLDDEGGGTIQSTLDGTTLPVPSLWFARATPLDSGE